MSAPHHSVFYRLDALHVAQPTASKHCLPVDTVYWPTHLYTRHLSVTCTQAPSGKKHFNGLFSRTSWVSQHRKGWTSLNFNEARDDGAAVASAALLQTDNHASTSSLDFYTPDAVPDAQPAASKHWRQVSWVIMYNASIVIWECQSLTADVETDVDENRLCDCEVAGELSLTDCSVKA